MPRKDVQFAKQYMQVRNTQNLCWEMIRTALASVADRVIIPMQDYLGLGSEARMNLPSTLGTNWKWRLDKEALTEELAEKIYMMAKIYGRL